MAAPLQPSDLTPESAFQILIEGDDDRRYELMTALDSSPRALRLSLRDRIFDEVDSRYGPRTEQLDPTMVAMIRGWMVSAAAVATPEPDDRLRDLLARRLDPSVEPSDWVRYWSLANLSWKFPHEAAEFANKAEHDRSDLVAALAMAIRTQENPSLVDRLVGDYLVKGHAQLAWAVLRALQVRPLPAAVPSVVQLLRTASAAAEDEGIIEPAQLSTIYDGLLALATPQTAELAADEIIRVIGPRELVRLVLLASGGARRHALRRMARLLGIAAGHSESVVAALKEAAARDDQLRAIVDFYLEQLGIEGAPAVEIPKGPDRIDLAYRLVLQHPAQFELLETFNPARLRQLAQTAGLTLPEPAEPPNALWRAWVETTQAARLSED